MSIKVKGKKTQKPRPSLISHLLSSVDQYVQLFTTPWMQPARPPSPSPTPRVYSSSCPLSQWCHPTISSSVVPPFSSCPQSFPVSGSFPMSQFFTSGGQSYWSFSFSISPSNEYSGLISFKMDWLDLPGVQGTLKSLLQYHSLKARVLSFLYSPSLTSIHDY